MDAASCRILLLEDVHLCIDDSGCCCLSVLVLFLRFLWKKSEGLQIPVKLGYVGFPASATRVVLRWVGACKLEGISFAEVTYLSSYLQAFQIPLEAVIGLLLNAPTLLTSLLLEVIL